MLRALFFDFNGVLVDDELLHFRALKRVLKEEGIELSQDEYLATYLARDDKGCFSLALKQAGRGTARKTVDALINRKSRYYEQLIQDGFSTLPGAEAFVHGAGRKYPVGLVSGALRAEIDEALECMGLEDAFSVIVSSEDVPRSKPDPACYRLALERLNQKLNESIRPEECVVFEDALGGIEAAKQAGMKCIALSNTYPPERLKSADLCAASFEGLTLGQVEQLFRPVRSSHGPGR